ncbi:MAG: hypothetical protein KAH11_10060 [Rhodospirillales bacterium]|nr:hypothetical protein [Rhodospirillales bacterium]
MASVKVFGKELCEIKSVSGPIYLGLWGVSAAGLWVFGQVPESECGAGSSFSLGCFVNSIAYTKIFLIATILHQGMLYYDIHDIDHGNIDEFVIEQEIGWFNSWPEYVLRLLIFVTLLFGVGKLSSILLPSLDAIEENGFVAGETLGAVKILVHQPDVLFVTGCYYFFSFLIAWNLLSLVFYYKKAGDIKKNGKNIELWVRILFSIPFLVLGISAWFFWGDVHDIVKLQEDGKYYSDAKAIAESATLFVIVYTGASVACLAVLVDAKLFKMKYLTAFVRLLKS